MTPEQIHEHVEKVILARLNAGQAGRGEALREFMALSLPSIDEKTAETVAAMVPELPEALYRRWIGLFAARLIETIPQNQLDDLCSGSAENDATLALVYLMFMESARMEKQVAEDLAQLGGTGANADGLTPPPSAEAQLDALAMYLKARLRQKTENHS